MEGLQSSQEHDGFPAASHQNTGKDAPALLRKAGNHAEWDSDSKLKWEDDSPHLWKLSIVFSLFLSPRLELAFRIKLEISGSSPRFNSSLL